MSYLLYPDTQDPEVICASEENKELKWIAGKLLRLGIVCFEA
jgi:hypothetical protein